ncbi:phage terminase large subunit [Escherichia coli]|nr:phage terminase large subunit [Escherichia coli]
MSITEIQMNNFVLAVKAGLSVLKRPLPMTPVEWADANYYLPKESAYQEGRWETLPFQRAIMNAMGSDYIREVNVVKSARVGYEDVLWPEAASDETKKRTAFAGTAISIV